MALWRTQPPPVISTAGAAEWRDPFKTGRKAIPPFKIQNPTSKIILPPPPPLPSLRHPYTSPRCKIGGSKTKCYRQRHNLVIPANLCPRRRVGAGPSPSTILNRTLVIPAQAERSIKIGRKAIPPFKIQNPTLKIPLSLIPFLHPPLLKRMFQFAAIGWP